jgi:hypothetical protein
MSVAPWINDASTAVPSVRKRTARTKGSVEVTARKGVLGRAAVHAGAFLVLSGGCYGFLSLMGHSLYSAAYKARSNAEMRTENARQDVLELGRQVSALVSTESLDRWARTHGFDRPGMLVAMNHASEAQSANQ